MLIKTVVCLIFVIVLICSGCICGNVDPQVQFPIHRTRDVKISKNVTIHRNGHGRLLRLLTLLKGFRQRKHIYDPYVLSRLWRASFEFELKPLAISEHVFHPITNFPTHFGTTGTTGTTNNGVGSNSIDSIFHFGNNEQQSSVTIGGSNQIVKGPDERDEIPVVESPAEVIHKDAINSVISVSTNETDEKSERVLRHAIQSRLDEDSPDDEEIDVPTTAQNMEEVETSEIATQSLTMPQDETAEIATQSLTMPEVETAEISTQSLTMPEVETAEIATQSLTIPQTTISTETVTESITTIRPESSSTVSNKVEPSSVSSPLSSQWQGYYDFGIYKPEFIHNIEFTTNYPTQSYVTYVSPFKPSLPDYTNTKSYYSNFFVPLRYFKR